jgi:Lrp/AsnC family leucine-responsive transcriptional regulator
MVVFSFMREIDDIDASILGKLQSNARVSNSEIARAVGLTPSAITDRIRRLERDGIVLGYEARIAPKALGAGLLAFVAVRANDRPGELSTAARLAEVSGVQEVHHVAGEDCFLVKVRTASPAALGRLLREEIGSIESVLGSRSTIVLETVIEHGRLEVPKEEA